MLVAHPDVIRIVPRQHLSDGIEVIAEEREILQPQGGQR
jgi:hypothetical protein